MTSSWETHSLRPSEAVGGRPSYTNLIVGIPKHRKSSMIHPTQGEASSGCVPYEFVSMITKIVLGSKKGLGNH